MFVEIEWDGYCLVFNQVFVEFGLDWYWDENFYGWLFEIIGGKECICYFVEWVVLVVVNWLDFVVLVKKLYVVKIVYYL